jgi:PAS domain S-box-containing protein
LGLVASEVVGEGFVEDRSEVRTEPLGQGATSDEMFRRLVDSVRDYAIFLLDAKGHVASWNIGAQRIKGYTAPEIIGRHFSTFYPEEQVRSGLCEFELKEAERTGRFEDEGWRIRKDGTRFWASVVISAVRDDGGRLVGFSKVTRDLTERKQSEEAQAALLAAEQANRAKDDFVAVLGHELRNPLSAILTALQLMELNGDRSTTLEQKIIARQASHMLRLIDDLLDVSRAGKGKIVIEKRRVSLPGILTKAIDVATPLLEQRGHRFELEMPNYTIDLDADEVRLTQVFANLLVNAAKYTPSDGHIRLKVRGEGDAVFVSVHDNGVGIPAALLPRIFDPFVQGCEEMECSAGGLGIGLTLVRSFVSLHGGQVTVESPGAGMGSTFTVQLPIAHGGQAESAKTLPTSGVRTVRKHRILIVDDNEDAVTLLARILSDIGYEVRTAYDAEAALEVAQEFEPDIAILDIGLPVMDGYQLASRLRARFSPEKPRLIAMSGFVQQKRPTEFSAYFMKPIDPQQLIAVIEAA